MRDALAALLSREWSGIVIAGAVAACGGALALGWPGDVGKAIAGLAWALAAVLALASLWHLLKLARTRRAHPPPGRLIELGGYRVHVLAEGTALDGRPPVVWFAGGHAAGHAIQHLHRALREDTRSILIDRPGTGWSDTGPFPRTTAREAEEMVLALERGGEKGPFIFAGHSFGGLLCANIARRRPDLVHTLVLLDPTPLETIVFGPRFSAIREMRRGALLAGLANLFGIDLAARQRREQAANPAYAKVLEATEQVLGPQAKSLRALDARAGNGFSQASIYRELSPAGAGECGWDVGVYDGDLGELPLLLVAPRNDVDVNVLPEANTADAADNRRAVRRLAASRERYLAASTRSRRVLAPAHTGHNFIYEEPQFVIDVVRSLLDGRA